MKFNAIIKSDTKVVNGISINGIYQSDDIGTISNEHRAVTIYNVSGFDITETKKLQEVVSNPVTKQKWTSDKNNYRYIDMKWIQPTFDLKGTLSGDRDGNIIRTTTTGSMTNVQTTIPVTDLALVEDASATKPSYIEIDGEMMKYTGKSAHSGAGNLTGVVRGIFGTTAATHASGASLFHPAWHFSEMLRYIFEAGGTFILYYPAYASVEQSTIAIGRGDTSIDTTLCVSHNVNCKMFKIRHMPSDGDMNNLEVTLQLVEGEDL